MKLCNIHKSWFWPNHHFIIIFLNDSLSMDDSLWLSLDGAALDLIMWKSKI